MIIFDFKTVVGNDNKDEFRSGEMDKIRQTNTTMG